MDTAILESDSSDSEFEFQMQEMILNPENHVKEEDPDARDKPIDFRMDRLPPPEVREAMDPRGMWQSANTGPKGVLNDYKEAQLHMATERMRGEMRNERMLKRMAEGEKKVVYQEAIPIEEQLAKKKAKEDRDSDESDSDSDLTDESDDEAFRKYKLEQIKMVQNSLPHFGSYDRMSNEEFAKCIHNTHELCYIVAHLYQNHVAVCTRLHLCFESLAAQFPQIRFVRIKATEAIKNYKDTGLPSIMLYRGGKMVESYVRVHEAIGKSITDVSVSRWLSTQGVLKMPGNEFYDQVKPTVKPRTTEGVSSDEDY